MKTQKYFQVQIGAILYFHKGKENNYKKSYIHIVIFQVKKLVEVMEARIKATPGGSNTAAAATTTTGSTTSGAMSLRSGTSSSSAAATVAAKRLQYSTSGRAAAVAAAAAAAIQQQAASSAAKLRSSIDKRKQRVSGSKAESKRASMRKVNALFKGLNETGIDQV